MRETREDELAMAYSRGLDDGVDLGRKAGRITRRERRVSIGARIDYRMPPGAIPESSRACCVHSVRSSNRIIRKAY